MSQLCKNEELEQGGVSLVEFALTLPFLIFLIMGAFDIGWAVYINNSEAVAAREGARRAIIVKSSNNVGPDSVCVRTRNALQGIALNCYFQDTDPGSNDQGIFVQPAVRDESTAGKPVKVTIQYLYHPITPLLNPIMPNGIMLTSSAVMVAE